MFTLLASIPLIFTTAGCAPSLPGEEFFTVVSSNKVYDQIAKDLWGYAGEITFVHFLGDNNIDPHGFEPSAAQRLQLANADLVIYAGTSADQYMSTMVESTNFPIENTVVGKRFIPIAACATALCFERQDNPHLWFDLKNVEAVAEQVTAKYKASFPKLSEKLDQNLHTFKADLHAMQDTIDYVTPRFAGKGFFAPESIANVLLVDMEFINRTPKSIATKFANEVELSVKEMKEVKALFDSGAVDLYVANIEVESQQAQEILEYALSLDIPVIEYSENSLCLTGDDAELCRQKYYFGYQPFTYRILNAFGETVG
jgi:ABC-type Zn uptake system ZnuABC Zn-binding protein ZnuA